MCFCHPYFPWCHWEVQHKQEWFYFVSHHWRQPRKVQRWPLCGANAGIFTLICLVALVICNTNRIGSILWCITQGSEGKYSGDHCMWLAIEGIFTLIYLVALVRCNTKRIGSILWHVTQGSQGKNRGDCCMWLPQAFLPWLTLLHLWGATQIGFSILGRVTQGSRGKYRGDCFVWL